MKKMILLLVLILLLTGCQAKNTFFCTSINKDDKHIDTYNLNVTFDNDILKTMSLLGTSTYKEETVTASAYNIVKDGYDQLQDLDKNIKTEVYYTNKKLYYSLQLDTNNINANGLKYLQNIFNINSSYPHKKDFMNYIEKNNYICD